MGRGGKIISLCARFQQKLSPDAALRVRCPTWDLSHHRNISSSGLTLQKVQSLQRKISGVSSWMWNAAHSLPWARTCNEKGIMVLSGTWGTSRGHPCQGKAVWPPWSAQKACQMCAGAEMQSYDGCHREGVHHGLGYKAEVDRTSKET